MLYKNLFQLYPDNFQNKYLLLSDKLEDTLYTVVTASDNNSVCTTNHLLL